MNDRKDPGVDEGISPQSNPGFHRHDPPVVVVLLVSVALLVLIAYIDIVTGTDFSLAFCYVVPVLLATWFARRWTGIVVAALSAYAWFYAESLGAFKYQKPMMAYWNFLWRFSFLVLAALQLSGFKMLYRSLEATVAARTRTLRELGLQLSQAEDSERKRVAFDIHDSLGQILTVLKLILSTPTPDRPDGSLPRQRKDDAIAMVDDLIHRSRTLIFDLHPAMLDQFGLVATMARYAQQFADRVNTSLTVSETGVSRNLPSPIASCLFRSIKEILNNSIKHGHAKQVVVRVHWEPSEFRIVIDDDGDGFDPSLLSPDGRTGLGLAGIRERLSSLGGALRIESTVGEGTRVVVEVPLPEACVS